MGVLTSFLAPILENLICQIPPVPGNLTLDFVKSPVMPHGGGLGHDIDKYYCMTQCEKNLYEVNTCLILTGRYGCACMSIIEAY